MEGSEVERAGRYARLGRLTRLEHEDRVRADREPHRARARVAHDRETEPLLIERDESIDVVATEREMMEPHGIGAEDSGAEGAPRLTDAHCHLDFPAFDADRDALIAELRMRGVTRHVVAGYTPERARGALALRDASTRVCVGIHPWALADWSEADDDVRLADLEARAAGADGIGELGLDEGLVARGVPMARQVRVAGAALAVAVRARKPVVLHVVGAHAAMQALLTSVAPEVPAMVHAFEAPAHAREAWLRLGVYLSVGRAVLDPRRTKSREAATNVPLDRLLLESDAPAGRTPDDRRIEPGVLLDVAREVAALRGMTMASLARATSANAARMFGFDSP